MDNKMFVFVHTVTMTYMDYEISAQFYHGMASAQDEDGHNRESGNRLMFKLIGKRVVINSRNTIRPSLKHHVNQHRMLNYHNGGAVTRQTNLKTSMKPRRDNKIHHSLRTVSV